MTIPWKGIELNKMTVVSQNTDHEIDNAAIRETVLEALRLANNGTIKKTDFQRIAESALAWELYTTLVRTFVTKQVKFDKKMERFFRPR